MVGMVALREKVEEREERDLDGAAVENKGEGDR
jgi:hypothetical protein